MQRKQRLVLSHSTCLDEVAAVPCRCGIFGYYTYGVKKDLQFVLDTLFNGLKRLEYRGYDSAGIAVELVDPWSLSSQVDGAHAPANGSSIPEENGVHDSLTPLICKEVGKVEQLERLTFETIAQDAVELDREFHNQAAIAHTRWATHGVPSAVNSHPQVSDLDCEFTVVHNGIITNYKFLKEFLVKNGERFVSDTDTEVIPKLCKFVYDRLREAAAVAVWVLCLLQLVMEVLKRLEGAYALLFKSTHYPGQLVACKRGSPLILGMKDPLGVRRTSFSRIQDATDKKWRSTSIECWVASDAVAVLEHTKRLRCVDVLHTRVIVMEDNDVLHLTGGGYGIYNTSQQDVEEAVPRVLLTLKVEVEQIMKGGFDHYMQKEIHEQPESLLQTMRGRVQFQRPAVGNPYLTPRIKLGGLVETADTIRRCRRIMLIGCGTSYLACLATRQTMEDMAEVPVVLELASDLLDRRCPIFRDDTCVFVSQSGETADTLMALDYAKSKGALCVGVTNTVGSSISRGTHCGIHLNAGYEIAVGSTKAYTSQILAITMMALQLAEDNILKGGKRDCIIDELGQLPGKVRSTLMLDSAMRGLAAQLKDEHSLMFFARGYNYATALEAALKIKEVALIHSEGILAGEMKHGPLALVDENLAIIVVATRDAMYKKMDSVIQQLLARSAKLFILCNEGDEAMRAYEKQGCHLIQVPETVDCLQPVLNIVPLQLLTYHLTVLRGHDVDQPRNLAKRVWITYLTALAVIPAPWAQLWVCDALECGIFGYYTYGVKKDLQFVLDTLFNGLKRLEYRGYDSAGIAVELVDPWPLSSQVDGAHAPANGSSIPEENGVHDSLTPLICKEVGKVEQLERLTFETIAQDAVELDREFHNQAAIAHTRWATHGVPSAVNSHPQVSDLDCEFTVVHNGIITNYKLLKEFLVKNGERFVSDTDTEVIPKLCKFVYDRLTTAAKAAAVVVWALCLLQLVMEVLKKLEGAYALLFKSTHYPGQLVACKRGSPLILGIRDPLGVRRTSFSRIQDATDKKWRSTSIECWVASDASAVVEHTKRLRCVDVLHARVIVMEDNDVLHLTGGGYGIYNTSQQDVEEAVPRVLLTLQVEVEQIMKGGFDHYMQKEIHEQPESLLQTMRGRVQFQRPAVGNPYLTPRIKLGGLVETADTIRRCRRIMFVACGTSFNACLATRQTVEDMCDVPVVLELASDLLDRRCPIFRDDTCVFVSQSGETADTLMALDYAKSKGALCVGVTNTVGSSISRGTHCGIHLNAGYEIGVASTKAYTSQILAITMMALQLAEDSIAKREKRDCIIDELGQLPGKVRSTLMLDSAMRDLAVQLKDEHSLMFFARGYNYATALEAALKTKEVALIHSEGILAGEMKHGPLALVDENLAIIVVATRDAMYKKMDSVIQQLLARSAKLFILCNEGDEAMRAYEKQGCHLIQVPETVDCLQPVLNIVPLQLLSYHLTLIRGHNVDQPRNLAKSVTTSEEH
ncbi:hypothetical protein QJQ45_013440 [Haematococcus lacustris]|nr:hypothetical protein QJQ45_013440 [Haematococcus lacustris]